MNGLRRMRADIRARRNIEVYALTLITLVFSLLSIVSDVLPENMRWGALLAAVGLLVHQITSPGGTVEIADQLLHDRSAFDETPLSRRLRTAREVWVFAPSAANVLSGPTVQALRAHVLRHEDAIVRVVVLDPAGEPAVTLAARQLGEHLDFPVHDFRSSLADTVGRLRLMATWPVKGAFAYRLLGYNPGFSMVVLDPGAKGGTAIVEFHGFHNDTSSSRMHLELTRERSKRWYRYWIDQFEHIWEAGAPDRPPAGSPRDHGASDGRETGDGQGA
ncbi:hypothetical protein [Streptosporangium sp. NPDC051022]|uniref:hypothetical protein n=1 Tax=Streptosporangium sp. NPDC051022 TaxID=3155752 RepID=UPI003441A38E